mgnify:CR=1 FL=1
MDGVPLAVRRDQLKCGVAVVDLAAGRVCGMLQFQSAVEEIFDVRAVRILVETNSDCYAALGVVHNRWPYLRGEFDDYIAAPKDNFYQSLHTAVIYDDKRPLEVQIRTSEMHQNAEYGIAAHWRYKEGGEATRQAWIDLGDLEDEDPSEFLTNLKANLARTAGGALASGALRGLLREPDASCARRRAATQLHRCRSGDSRPAEPECSISGSSGGRSFPTPKIIPHAGTNCTERPRSKRRDRDVDRAPSAQFCVESMGTSAACPI